MLSDPLLANEFALLQSGTICGEALMLATLSLKADTLPQL